MKKQKQKKIPTSEAALERGIKKIGYDPILVIFCDTYLGSYHLRNFSPEYQELIPEDALWRGRLSDLIKKRKPLKKGVMKKLKRAIR